MKIRRALASDSAALARLCGQLSYPTTAAQARLRLRLIERQRAQAVFVAQEGTAILGWIHVFACPYLEAEPGAELGGLVVDETARGRGVGQRLLERAERWSAARKLPYLRFSSRIVRKRAHRFYRRLGYSVIKTSHIFEKRI